MTENGRVEIVLGCMFSGKSTELLRRLSRYEAIGKDTLLINTDAPTDIHLHFVIFSIRVKRTL